MRDKKKKKKTNNRKGDMWFPSVLPSSFFAACGWFRDGGRLRSARKREILQPVRGSTATPVGRVREREKPRESNERVAGK